MLEGWGVKETEKGWLTREVNNQESAAALQAKSRQNFKEGETSWVHCWR